MRSGGNLRRASPLGALLTPYPRAHTHIILYPLQVLGMKVARAGAAHCAEKAPAAGTPNAAAGGTAATAHRAHAPASAAGGGTAAQ